MPPLDTFLTCNFQPTVSSESSILRSGDAWKLAGFFQDSSLRTTFSLPLQVECPSQAALDEIVGTKCFDLFLNPIKTDAIEAEARAGDDDDVVTTCAGSSRFSFAVEAKVVLTFGTGESLFALVENVIVKSTRTQDLLICIDTELTLRVRSESGQIDPSSVVKINLEVGAVLTENLPVQTQAEAAVAGLKALNLGGLPEIGLKSQEQRIRCARHEPFALVVSLAFAMKITAQSFPSHIMGQTYVSLTISHTSMHKEPLTISNIALHPGHSMVLSPMDSSSRQQVTDMSRFVKWTYAPDCAPSLPLTLESHESYSTVLIVYATGDKLTRSFSSPISVTASVGNSASSNLFRSVVAACDVQWTTCRAAVEPADAFRVDLRVTETEPVFVGALLTVELEITNLSPELRQLMILVDSGRAANLATDKHASATAAAVSSKGGHKFGVWGLLDIDSISSCVDRAESQGAIDEDLLAVDVALLVGDVDAGISTRAEIRFVALRDGTHKMPNLRILDRRKGKWYIVQSNLQVVVQPAAAGS